MVTFTFQGHGKIDAEYQRLKRMNFEVSINAAIRISQKIGKPVFVYSTEVGLEGYTVSSIDTGVRPCRAIEWLEGGHAEWDLPN